MVGYFEFLQLVSIFLDFAIGITWWQVANKELKKDKMVSSKIVAPAIPTMT